MPPKKSKASASRRNIVDVSKAWAVARPDDPFRYDKTPKKYSREYCLNIKPTRDDRSFRSSIGKLVHVEVWDIAETLFFDINIPSAYIIHIWWIQMQAKFWMDICEVPGEKTMATYLMWLVDNFVKEAVEDIERDVMAGGWRSKALHYILCRTFFHMQEQDPITDFTVVLRSARNSTGNDTLEFGDIGSETFWNVYNRSDVMSDQCRESVYHLVFNYFASLMPMSGSAWRSRVNQNHGLRWFMRKATLRPTPWRPRSEIAYDAVSSNALYDYIEAFDGGDIFVDPEYVQADYPHVDSDEESPCGSCPSSVKILSLHIRPTY
jgi:hypothetical protein